LDQAFDSLQRGLLNAGPEWARWIEHDSTLETLRGDPRYHQLIEEIKKREGKTG